jgi:acyl-CoA thioesterase II
MCISSYIPSPDHDDLNVLLALSSTGERSYRNCALWPIPIARFGAGRLVGQALWAASQSARGWSVSALQLCMLRAPQFDDRLEYAVEASGESSQSLTRQVYGVEGLETVFSMQVRFAIPDAFSPSPSRPAAFGAFDETLLVKSVANANELTEQKNIPLVEVQQIELMDRVAPRKRFWLRLKRPVPIDYVWCASALGYMSASAVPAVFGVRNSFDDMAGWYFDSRDFSMFFHSGFFDANEWMLFDTELLLKAGNQYTFETRIHARSGLHLATCMHTYVGRNEL